ncbi:hypothetical protein GOHSU_21_00060 [Gordonia hirsuta DSM 44140 = NBRC 16056]|uniref:Uncharacterized protein n=1 Tax=Gordonia hirsuta DSM 44140 = NBRC 16056 TaxID=1121927 RepID=L7L9D9_9ACTN|nr:hypothetical protein GOHSU_21_00060 [Gordonia hirsuta DSM 44140 = NBRC 16056]
MLRLTPLGYAATITTDHHRYRAAKTPRHAFTTSREVHRARRKIPEGAQGHRVWSLTAYGAEALTPARKQLT